MGNKLSQTFNIPTSNSTFIRLIHRQELYQRFNVIEVGIDDWAFKKGYNYVIAIVDLVERKIIDLLPDREEKTVENWLCGRPNINIVTRDRFSRYAKGVTNGATQATQIADRWHIIKNMGEAVTKLLERIRQSIRPELTSKNISDEEYIQSGDQSLTQSVSGSISKRNTQLEQIKQHYKNKVPIQTIAKIVGVSRNTVKKYLYLNKPPPKIPARSNLTEYVDYIKSRIRQDSNIEILQLWNEVKEKGYNGSRTVFYEHLKGYSKGKRNPMISPTSIPYWSARKVRILLYRKKRQLSTSENELLNKLKTPSEDIQSAASFVSRFKNLLERITEVGFRIGWMI
ncbi:Helix-turn-helix domain of resolvase [Chitinophaga sancti]|uniref:Helix-turn-helix domain of resolvase n=1 Tax=Chitinophaga sancti TaxID=1004 RepID=A0A1K1T298_9BACT|nr:Helix-turn-helix domain of resolvase [Chitinophaga sancti]